MLGKKKKEELTPEEYRQQARDEIEDAKKEWSVFLKTGIIMIAALIAIIIAGIAWFVSNNRVKGSGTKIQAAGSEFDLAAAETEAGVYDHLLDVPAGTEVTLGGKKYSSTDGGPASIAWAITDASNIKNNTASGIEPGSSGKMTFYIISHKDGPLSVSLGLTITGYKGEESAQTSASIQPLSDKSEGQQLLEGHVLLFAGYDSDTKHYKGWISEDADPWTMKLDDGAVLTRTKEGSLTWSTENAENDTAYPVTLYWIWPEALESYLMSADTYTGRRPLLFAENSGTDGSALPNELFVTMCTTSDEDAFNRYFCWKDASAFAADVTPGILSQLRTNFNPVIYGTVAAYYDMADQYLGENVRFMKLKLDAQ